MYKAGAVKQIFIWNNMPNNTVLFDNYLKAYTNGKVKSKVFKIYTLTH